MNRLQAESSPYLRQHAGNPVDWLPWGSRAFEKAKREGKPLFVSIGYSTCHWCHVMEKDSFEDEGVAKLLNELFVPVKVDREERPEVDSLYMGFCQATSGAGGWPLSIFATPEGKPFFAATFIPKDDAYGKPGMLSLLPMVSAAWNSKRGELESWARDFSASMAKGSAAAPAPEEADLRELLDRAFEDLAANFDPEEGGIGRAPKFPQAHRLLFLRRYGLFAKNEAPLKHVELTLERILCGGVRDQLGGGLHRYAVDPKWKVPHFEKMLYDQALAAFLLAESLDCERGGFFANALEELLAYVSTRLRSPEGAFFSAEDADSEGEEGRFYAWTPKEIESLPAPGDAALAFELFALASVETPASQTSGDDKAPSTLSLKSPLFGGPLPALKARMLVEREKRPRPFLDAKALCSWNGLMIGGLAKASLALKRKDLLAMAAAAADFILAAMRRNDGRLLRSFIDGKAGVEGSLEDYAYLAWGLTELHQASFDNRRLKEALEIVRSQNRLFSGNGGLPPFSLEPLDAESLLPFNPSEHYDSALPCGESVAILNNVRLATLSGDEELEKVAAGSIESLRRSLALQPAAAAFSLLAIMERLEGSVAVVAEGDDGGGRLMAEELRQAREPGLQILLKPQGALGKELEAIAPTAKGKTPLGASSSIHICVPGRCLMPFTDAKAALNALKASQPDA